LPVPLFLPVTAYGVSALNVSPAREGKVKGSGPWLRVVAFLLTFLPGAVHGAEKVITMSTTTSTQASGLLDVLLPSCLKDTGITVNVIAKGTGAAIRDGMDGNVDIIFVHARAREEKFVVEGYGTKRYAVMHNDFVIVGPPDDPAGVRGMGDAAGALRKISSSKSLFVSRGDDSGTHTRERELWRLTGLDPGGGNDWYLSIGQGMGKTLTFADEKKAYTLADRGTCIKYRYGRDLPVELEVLVEGDPALVNPYGVIPVSPERYPRVRHDLARQFAEWLVSERGQSVIGGYRLLGRQLFIPDAGEQSASLREGGDEP
jgi:tungstate transport system substrate-binding protein